MNNKPTLFVSSICLNESGKENQKYFDSRKSFKSKVLHRIDDVISFITFGKRVFLCVNYLNKYYCGEVIGIKYNFII